MCLSLGLCKHAGVPTKQEIGVAGVAAGFTADFELPDVESGNRTLSFKSYYIFLKWLDTSSLHYLGVYHTTIQL